MSENNSDSNNMGSSLGMEENAAAAVSYLLGFISGILVFIVEKKSDFVKFHAMQSTIVFLGLFIVFNIVGIIPFINLLLAPIMFIVSFLLWGFLLYKAYQGEKFKLPVIGDIAENQAKNLEN